MTWQSWLILHALGVLFTTALVTALHGKTDAHGQPWKYLLAILLLAQVWPLMLLGELWVWRRNRRMQRRVERPATRQFR